MDGNQMFLFLLNAFWTLSIMSFLIGDNPIYSIGENTMMAIGMAWIFALGAKRVVSTAQNLIIVQHQYIWIIPFILGAMMYTRYSKKYGWLSRYPIAILVGGTIGLVGRTAVEAQLVRQVQSALQPLWTTNPMTTFNNLITIISILSVLMFFFFTRTPAQYRFLDPLRNRVNMIGRSFMMMAFGIYLGNRIMGEVSRIIERFLFLLGRS